MVATSLSRGYAQFVSFAFIGHMNGIHFIQYIEKTLYSHSKRAIAQAFLVAASVCVNV